MNLFKPAAIYIGFNWLSGRLDEYIAEIDELDNEKKLRVKKILEKTDDPQLVSTVNDYFDKRKPIEEIVEEIMNHHQTKMLIGNAISDHRFTESEIVALLESVWRSGLQSEYDRLNESKFSKILKGITNSRQVIFFTQPLGFFILLFACMVQLASFQYLRNHFSRKEFTGIKIWPPVAWFYAVDDLVNHHSKKITDSVIYADLNKSVYHLQTIIDSNINSDVNNILMNKSEHLYALYDLHNRIINNYDSTGIKKFGSVFKFNAAAMFYGKQGIFATLKNYAETDKFNYLELTKYIDLRSESRGDSIYSRIITNIDSLNSRMITESVRDLNIKAMDHGTRKVLLDELDRASQNNFQRAELQTELFKKIFTFKKNDFF